MKKAYEAPVVEKVEFCYAEQIVASTGATEPCIYFYYKDGGGCHSTFYDKTNL